MSSVAAVCLVAPGAEPDPAVRDFELQGSAGTGLESPAEAQHTGPMALQVIGAGFGRTGTTSLKAALEQLGFSKCHHMEEVMKSGAQVRFWQTLSDGGEVAWDEVFDGFQSSCDWPSCSYWEELHHHYPDAKIVLTVRDETRWYESVLETIYPATFLLPGWLEWLVPPLARLNKMIVASIWNGVFGGRFEDREHALQVYRDHIARVKATAPPDRLLVFEAKDGWAPLCSFLNVAVPENDYPHLNDAAQIRRLIRAVRALGWLSLALLLGGFGTLLIRVLG